MTAIGVETPTFRLDFCKFLIINGFSQDFQYFPASHIVGGLKRCQPKGRSQLLHIRFEVVPVGHKMPQDGRCCFKICNVSKFDKSELSQIDIHATPFSNQK